MKFSFETLAGGGRLGVRHAITDRGRVKRLTARRQIKLEVAHALLDRRIQLVEQGRILHERPLGRAQGAGALVDASRHLRAAFAQGCRAFHPPPQPAEGAAPACGKGAQFVGRLAHEDDRFIERGVLGDRQHARGALGHRPLRTGAEADDKVRISRVYPFRQGSDFPEFFRRKRRAHLLRPRFHGYPRARCAAASSRGSSTKPSWASTA